MRTGPSVRARREKLQSSAREAVIGAPVPDPPSSSGEDGGCPAGRDCHVREDEHDRSVASGCPGVVFRLSVSDPAQDRARRCECRRPHHSLSVLDASRHRELAAAQCVAAPLARKQRHLDRVRPDSRRQDHCSGDGQRKGGAAARAAWREDEPTHRQLRLAQEQRSCVGQLRRRARRAGAGLSALDGGDGREYRLQHVGGCRCRLGRRQSRGGGNERRTARIRYPGDDPRQDAAVEASRDDTVIDGLQLSILGSPTVRPMRVPHEGKRLVLAPTVKSPVSRRRSTALPLR